MDLRTILGIGGLAVLAIAYNRKLLHVGTSPIISLSSSGGRGGY